jgi:peptidoglycan/xylan/chitin deacetylase (PgdA/CDA1 family)
MLKRIAKLGISLIFYVTCSLWNSIRRFSGRAVAEIGVVLYYHSVPAASRTKFARQMDVLLDLATPIRADADIPLDKRHVAVTFDDGFQDLVENALPELKRRNIPSTLFVVVELLGQVSNWHQSSDSPGVQVMSVEQLRGLPCDLVTIGSHTMRHPRLTALDDSEAWEEIHESRVRLERVLGREVRLFSFPYGDFNAKLVDLCRRAGYERVFTGLPFLMCGSFVTGRVVVEPTDWSLEFRLKLLGAYRWLPFAFALKRRVLSSPVAHRQRQRAL